MITVENIPKALKNNKHVTPFIARLSVLFEDNPIVSYFCRLYVLEHILSRNLHEDDNDVEEFTSALLDDTEPVKMSCHDETVKKVLASKQLSATFVFVSAFKIYNSCLKELSLYDGTSKSRLVQKMRATITYWLLLSLFKSANVPDPIDYGIASGGQCHTEEQFMQFARDKIKGLKFQMSRLLRDEVPIKKKEQEPRESELKKVDSGKEYAGKTLEEKAESRDAHTCPISDVFDLTGGSDNLAGHDLTHPASGNCDNSGITLPGAPRFDPAAGANPDDSLNLPGAPKVFPDNDLSQVNKKSPIHVFLPTSSDKFENVEKDENPESLAKNEQDSCPKVALQKMTSSNVVHVTKESLNAIVDTTGQIDKVQRHAKFAISALNYEDLDTAEQEMLKGLELLRLIKEKPKEALLTSL